MPTPSSARQSCAPLQTNKLLLGNAVRLAGLPECNQAQQCMRGMRALCVLLRLKAVLVITAVAHKTLALLAPSQSKGHTACRQCKTPSRTAGW